MTNDHTDSDQPRFPIEAFAKLASGLAHAQNYVHEVNVNNGWFDTGRTFGDDISLLHSEVSEMLEEFRNGVFVTEHDPNGKPIGVPSEAADVLIRLLDTCHRYGIDLAGEFIIKMNFNATRGYRHGNKKL